MSDKKDFSEKFPALKEELDAGGTKQYRIDGVRTVSEDSEAAPEEPYTPDVVDYIRRCETLNQALEIVDYLLKQNEITQGQARAIKSQLKSDGVRSFGAKKESGYYMQHGIE
ncbi:MAG: DUF2095 family protein [Candidatus Thorarchaeota archaeon]